MITLLHTSDWHLGTPFARFEGDLPARLREARMAAIPRLAEAARAAGARLVLAAGDLWDSDRPAPDQRVQALALMAEAADLTWALLPGNHDPARPGGLWERIAAEAPPNLLLLTEPRPVQARPGLWLLPAPATGPDPGRDLTAWMDAAPTPEGALRVGVGHGPAFDPGAAQSAAIAPDRAARAGLAYLALGDAHSPRRVGPRQAYSGTPEPDRFGLSGPGAALAVTLGSGDPEIREATTGRFAWVEAVERLAPGAGAPALEAHLPEPAARRTTLLRLRLDGALGLAERAAWEAAAARMAPALAHLELDTRGLETRRAPEDLDRIDRGGALRAAAETLAAEAEDPALAPEARAAAAGALALLATWCAEGEEP